MNDERNNTQTKTNETHDENYYRNIIQLAQNDNNGLETVQEGVDFSGFIKVVASKNKTK